MMINQQFDSGSFRDRTSRVFYKAGCVYRGLTKEGLNEWDALTATAFFSRFMSEGKLVYTERVDTVGQIESGLRGDWEGVLQHESIPFISYPYEWSFGMLKDAALLMLELLLAGIEEGVILKDSSAYNIQWKGNKPIFIDIPSFKRLQTGEPWVGYRQFCEMFLYPLLLQAYKDIPFQPWLRGSIDGIASEHCSRLMSVRDLLRPGVLTHVYLQSKMQRYYAQTQRNVKSDLHEAGFSKDLIKANVKRLAKTVQGLTWKRAGSEWSDYASQNSYTDIDQQAKMDFVREAVNSRSWNLVWDLGCNIGIFSRIAAKNARYVVAMDADHLTVECLYRSLKREGNTNTLPLVINLADASPNLGWRGLERKALTERGKPDLTLCLALIHHIVIGANIPLNEFIDWLASLGTDLVIEFITKEDPMVKTLLRNKDDQYSEYEIKYFDECLNTAFGIQNQRRLQCGTRFLYFARVRRQTIKEKS